ncbi:hypothetical protein Dsin_012605 [Dipteronia sinensis]|uniref:Uncharacterized protein n=1 Tax=Dipteronia sinensis TaxID=43782 RepID=A0AAE0E9L1_9ROSI|nr:hypothetical protein Dsin_012605 [Dipteronia sinensis]
MNNMIIEDECDVNAAIEDHMKAPTPEVEIVVDENTLFQEFLARHRKTRDKEVDSLVHRFLLPRRSFHRREGTFLLLFPMLSGSVILGGLIQDWYRCTGVSDKSGQLCWCSVISANQYIATSVLLRLRYQHLLVPGNWYDLGPGPCSYIVTVGMPIPILPEIGLKLSL